MRSVWPNTSGPLRLMVAACLLVGVAGGLHGQERAAAEDAAIMAQLDQHAKRRVAEFQKELPEGYRLRPGVSQQFSDDEAKVLTHLLSLTPVGPDGKAEGEARHYAGYGQVGRTVPYRQGLRHGVERRYHFASKGRERRKTLVAEIPWESGKIQGLKKLFHKANGKVQMEVPYRDGEQHGLAKQYDLPGRLAATIPYVGGKLHGERIDYWTMTGKRHRLIPFRQGKVHGLVREYHDNGALARERPVRDGLFQGIEKCYDEDGNLSATVFWIEDEKVSKEKYDKQAKR